MSQEQWFHRAYLYDFNNVHGQLVLDEVDAEILQVGDLVVLCDPADDDGLGIAQIVQVTGVRQAKNSDRWVVMTDHVARRFRTTEERGSHGEQREEVSVRDDQRGSASAV